MILPCISCAFLDEVVEAGLDLEQFFCLILSCERERERERDTGKRKEVGGHEPPHLAIKIFL